MSQPQAPAPESGSEKRHRPRFRSVYTVELVVGIGAALALFLLLLWVLDLGLPTGTGFGELVRAPQAARSHDPRLDFDASDGALVAVLADVRRDVREKPASSVVWSSARAGTPLGDRHAIQSYENSGASIRFGRNQWLELGENSVIVVRRPRRVEGSLQRRAAVLFMDGFLRGRLDSSGEQETEIELVVGGSTIRAAEQGQRPAEIELIVENDQTAVSVVGGTAAIVRDGEVTEVTSGHMVTYEPGRAPSEPEPLPRPPRLLEPRDGARFRFRQAPPAISFSWRSTDDATDFRLQIARDPEFRSLVYEDRLGDSSFVHGNLGAGEYYWRVFRHRGPVASLPTPTRRLVVARHDVAPSLTVELPDDAVKDQSLVVRGTTEPGCRVLIGDLAVPVDGSGHFEHELKLQHGYNFLLVQSVDPTGNAAFRNHTILADLAGAKRTP